MRKIKEILVDLKVLVSSAQEDFDKEFWANYEIYLEQYNSILEELHNMGFFQKLSVIKPVPQGQKAYMGVGYAQAERAKLREIANASRSLKRKLKTQIQEINQTEGCAQDPRNVFVIHGRNLEARDALFNFLRSIDLHPLEWSEIVTATGKGAPYIGEILDKAFSQAQAVVVLMTPDDEGRLREPFRKPEDPSYEAELTQQARLNVLFEAGMAIGRFPNRTILVKLCFLRPFSDIGGRHVIKLDDTTEKRQELAQRLRTAGCQVNLSGTDWHTAGAFEASIRGISEENKNPGLNVEMVSLPVNFSSFDESFKALEEVTQPKTKAALLTEFQPKLHNLCYNFEWSNELRDRIAKVLEYIPKKLSNDPNIDWYLQYLGMIINRHGEHTISMIKEKFLSELENLYHDPKYETNSKISSVLQKLHKYSESYLMKLIDDAAYQWSDKRFDVLGSNIEFWELKNKDSEAYEKVLSHLRRKMDETEKSQDEKAYPRFKKLYALARR